MAESMLPRRIVGAGTALLRRYTFAFAAILSIGLLVASLATGQPFPLTDNLAAYAPLALAAVASTPSIISGRGGIDLSISPTLNLVGVIYVAWLAPHGLGGAVSVLILLAVGAFIGAVNGVLVAVMGYRPIVATLCMFFALTGLNQIILPTPAQAGNHWITHLSGDIGPVPVPLLVLALPVLIWFLLDRIPYRRALFAVGGDDAASFSSGVNVTAVRIAAYALGGLFAAIAGFALLGAVNSADPGSAQEYTLTAVAAVALGGTPLFGGRGGITGALLGAAALFLLQQLLTTLQISPTWLQIVYGLILLVGVVLGSGLATPAAETA